ncbi:uncharacterized protein [Choristoneura fumiferana]|uniref:uncharacterized protein n=1 Tax=Choristoneura fumiferana TaxID=7141 RepID=UPI003D154AC8
MLSGRVCPEITDILYGANLCALVKKDGGIRPIAVGNTIRRIVSKICCRHALPDLTDLFQPIQLGFGSKGGCEAAVHAARTFLELGGGQVLLKVDVKNAFNAVDRAAFLTQVKEKIPGIYGYMWQSYASTSKLIFRKHLLHSAAGCQQGDPLGPAIFSLAIQPIISQLISKFNMWYLDDGTLGGEAEQVLIDLQNLIQNFQKIGLELNFSKCELFVAQSVPEPLKNEIISKFNTVAPNIKILTSESLHLLGSPVLPEAIPIFLDVHFQKYSDTCSRLRLINPHMALVITRYCLFVPKFMYFLRCCPFWQHESKLKPLDELIRKTLSEILNCSFDERSWTQATLPIRFGGLGVRSISSVALPAFLSSGYSTRDLFGKIINPSLGDVEVTHLAEARAAWSNTSPNGDIPCPLSHKIQRAWDEPICSSKQKQLLETSPNSTDRARLLAAGEPESGYWLQALPSMNIGTVLDHTTLCLAICLRLGLKTNESHQCKCGVRVDQYGHHGLSCQRSAGRFSRHASINDIIRRALVTVNVPAILEPTGMSRDDGKRPDGMTLIPWSRGRPLVWDATCVDTLAPSHIHATSGQAGAAAASAESNKRRKYAALGEACIFTPFGVETLGPWGPEAKQLFRQISSRLVDTSRDRRAGAYLAQRISLAIQRGNAASLLGTAPQSSSLEDIFYLV